MDIIKQLFDDIDGEKYEEFKEILQDFFFIDEDKSQYEADF